MTKKTEAFPIGLTYGKKRIIEALTLGFLSSLIVYVHKKQSQTDSHLIIYLYV